MNNMIECPFDEEWKFHKADLLALKDTQIDGYLNGKAFYAYSIPSVQYYLRINPYGNKENYRDQTGIFLYVNGSEKREITASFVISIKSANYNSKIIYHEYQKSIGHGSWVKTDQFFDSNNKFFVNGEVTIGIKGILKVARLLKISSPISTEWKIKESDLLQLKESKNGCLKGKRFMVSTFSDVKYYLTIYPNGDGEERKGHTYIALSIEIGNEKNIEAVFDLSIQSANFYFNTEYNFDKTRSWGNTCCSTNDLFDPSKHFIVNEFLTIKLNGILMVEKKSQITTMKLKKGVAPQADQKKKDKEFKIVIGNNKIKVHRKVLADASPFFAEMFESGKKEAIENVMIIEHFTFDIVDAAIKLCYSAGVRKISSIEEMFLLYKFADKYRIGLITEHVEEELTKKISSTNVCQLIHFSKSFNVTKLYQKCVDFLMKCSREGTAVYGANALDKDLVFSMFLNSLGQTAQTDG